MIKSAIAGIASGKAMALSHHPQVRIPLPAPMTYRPFRALFMNKIEIWRCEEGCSGRSGTEILWIYRQNVYALNFLN